MKTSQEIKALFNELPLGVQNELLGDLLIEQELQGKVLQEATQDVVKQRHKKPCPHCTSTKVYKRGEKMAFRCINVMIVSSGIVRQQERLCMTLN